MNINIYLEDSLAKSLNKLVKTSGQPRNAIIREAIHEYVIHHEHKKWPNSILNYKGNPNITPFENHRNDLLPPKEEPLE